MAIRYGSARVSFSARKYCLGWDPFRHPHWTSESHTVASLTPSLLFSFFLAYSPADLLLCFHKHQILLILSPSRYIDVQFWLKAVEFRNRGLGSVNTLEEGAWRMQLGKKK